jgi:hypothetical protein
MARYRPTAAETRAYETFARDHERPYCWLCGRGERDKPPDWHAPWLVCRAHIVSSPRVEVAWAVALLCPKCHGVSHGERHRDPVTGEYLPPVSRANLLWLKLTFDPARYSEKLLQSCCVGRLPSPEPPAEFYLECHRQRRPENARLIEQMLEF